MHRKKREVRKRNIGDIFRILVLIIALSVLFISDSK